MSMSLNCGTGFVSTTSPCRSCVLVATPKVSVPTYSLSSLINRSCTFVPRPIVNKSNPVAIGSSVPQWPTFLIPSWRRASATTSCEVMPSALSTSRTPSGTAADDITHFLQNFLFELGERAADARASCEHVAAAAKFFADRADVHFFALGTHADAHLPVREFLKEDSDDDAANRAQVVDETFVIFRRNTELLCRLETQTETGH